MIENQSDNIDNKENDVSNQDNSPDDKSTTDFRYEKRFDKTTRSMVSGLFLFGYVTVLLPVVLYTGSLALKGMFHLNQIELWKIVVTIGVLGSSYAIFGGLKSIVKVSSNLVPLMVIIYLTIGISILILNSDLSHFLVSIISVSISAAFKTSSSF